MVQIIPVTTKKQRKQFVEFPLKLYKGNSCYVPPLYADEMAMFKDNFTYNDQCKSAFFLAVRDGEVVGRIHGIWQFVANEKWGQSRVRFTRFESINDQEVANALLSAVEDWGTSLGMTEIVGPLGFSDMEREGLLVEGFDQIATFEENYNFDYYQTLIENYGYQKDVDWTGNKLYLPKGGIDPKIKEISDRMMAKYNLHFCTETNTNKYLKKYAPKIFAIWEDTYSKIYGTVPFSQRVMDGVFDQFRLMVKCKYVPLILDENDNVIAFGVCFPSIAKAVQKSGGRFTIPCLIRLLKAINKPEVLDVALIGVIDEYKNKGLNAAILHRLLCLLEEVDHAESNLMLEHNNPIQNMLKYFDAPQHKRHRCYIKQLSSEDNK